MFLICLSTCCSCIQLLHTYGSIPYNNTMSFQCASVNDNSPWDCCTLLQTLTLVAITRVCTNRNFEMTEAKVLAKRERQKFTNKSNTLNKKLFKDKQSLAPNFKFKT